MIECKVQRDRAAERNTEKIATLDAHCIKQSMQVRGMPERFVVAGNRLAAVTPVQADGACVQAELRRHPVPGPPAAREVIRGAWWRGGVCMSGLQWMGLVSVKNK